MNLPRRSVTVVGIAGVGTLVGSNLILYSVIVAVLLIAVLVPVLALATLCVRHEMRGTSPGRGAEMLLDLVRVLLGTHQQ